MPKRLKAGNAGLGMSKMQSPRQSHERITIRGCERKRCRMELYQDICRAQSENSCRQVLIQVETPIDLRENVSINTTIVSQLDSDQ